MKLILRLANHFVVDSFRLQDDKPNYSLKKIHMFGVFQGFSTQDAVE